MLKDTVISTGVLICRSFHSPSAEGKSAKVLVYCAQQLLGSGQAERHMAGIEVFHVMAAFQVLPHIALAYQNTTASASF